MKKIYLKLSILISIAIIGLIYSCNLYSDKETILNDVKLKEKVETNDLFAIKVETIGNDNTGTGEYTDETNIPLKENGYIFNREKSGCMNADGHLLNDVLTYRNNMIKVDVTGTTYCYLYFDYLDNADNFCVSQGITNLSDCLLVMDNYSLDREEAIDYINLKGEATTSLSSPHYTFKSILEEEVIDDTGGVFGGRNNFIVGNGYTFNTKTGMYVLKNITTKALDSNDIGKYTCGGLLECATMYKINDYSVNNYIYKITNYDSYTYSTTSSFDSETGIYATTDADGPTYFYRGNVTNNNVQFGGYYWKVVRINGDGSIRLIYAGTSATESGEDDQIGTSAYNSKDWNPTYAGYKHTEDYELKETSTIGSRLLTADRIYYFADSYIDNGNGTFKLSGNMIQGTWQEVYESGDWEKYHYTVLGTLSTSNLRVVYNIKGYRTETYMNATYISYVPKDYESTLRNETDSTIKTYIDSWYENNLLNATDTSGNNIIDYIYQDAKYCNDRSVYFGSNGGNGYLQVPTTDFMGLRRLGGLLKPSLLCNQNQDIYSVVNGNLDYPIALLTADEASYAGIRINSINEENYLTSGKNYWTMTPAQFSASYLTQRNFIIVNNGNFSNTTHLSYTNYGVRPVINLKSNVKITSGNGTTSNPYQLTID